MQLSAAKTVHDNSKAANTPAPSAAGKTAGNAEPASQRTSLCHVAIPRLVFSATSHRILTKSSAGSKSLGRFPTASTSSSFDATPTSRHISAARSVGIFSLADTLARDPAVNVGSLMRRTRGRSPLVTRLADRPVGNHSSFARTSAKLPVIRTQHASLAMRPAKCGVLIPGAVGSVPSLVRRALNNATGAVPIAEPATCLVEYHAIWYLAKRFGARNFSNANISVPASAEKSAQLRLTVSSARQKPCWIGWWTTSCILPTGMPTSTPTR